MAEHGLTDNREAPRFPACLLFYHFFGGEAGGCAGKQRVGLNRIGSFYSSTQLRQPLTGMRLG